MKLLSRICFTGVLGLLLMQSLLFAGNEGKIAGKVTDKQTGEVLFGVNIQLAGTTRGATTDLDGKYQIIGIPIGSYTVRASMVGYAQVEIKNVSVGADETTPLNFQLSDDAVQMTGVTVTADQQLVNSMTTGSTTTVNQEAIASIPNVKSVEDVLKLQAGVVKQGNNLFLRGGRSNEVVYLVDGMPTNNIVGNAGELSGANANAGLARLYAGVSAGVVGGGTSGLGVSANAIQSVSVQTSNFDADYGNAQSGIVNIVTKSGSEKFAASMQYRTDRIANTNQNENYSSFTFSGPEPLSKFLLPQMGLKLPMLTFFVSGDMNRSDGPYNYANNEFYNPINRRIELNGFLGGILEGVGFRYRDNQKNNFTFNSKLRMDLGGNGSSMQYGYRASLSTKHDYLASWKYRADSSSIGATLNIQHNFGLTHFLPGGKTFFKLLLAKSEARDGNDVAGISPQYYSSADDDKFDVNSDGFNDLGTGQRWYKSRTTQWQMRFDFTSQVHELHLLKTGLEFYYEEINSTEILKPTIPLNVGSDVYYAPFPVGLRSDIFGNVINTPDRGDFPGYGQARSHMNNYPNRGGLYLQDNIEFSGLNLHVGLRYDYFDIGRQVYDPDFVNAWKRAVLDTIGTDLSIYPDPKWVRDVGYDTVVSASGGKIARARGLDDWTRFKHFFTHGDFSPRLSIGYPVTDRIVFYFNYGHFLQYPDRDNYFRDPNIFSTSTESTDPWVGNPSLKPQRTVAYEAGFEDQFTDDMAFGLRAFYKDIFDYPTFVQVGERDVRLYQNFDYASARGFESTLNQSLSGNLSVNLTYTYQIAKGRSSSTFDNIFQEQGLPRETRLSWDQNHTANALMTYRVRPDEEGHFFGLPFTNNYGISLTWSFGSGFPYSPLNPRTNDFRFVYLVNSESKPYTSTVNLSLYKGIQISDGLNLLATLDVTNLLNRRNVINVLSYTGEAPKYGDLDPGDPRAGVVLPWREADAQLLDPTNFEAPRQILLGVKLNWE